MNYPRKVYAIQHNETKRIYVGSSSEVDKRYMNHIIRLRNGKHSVEDMQKDFDEYGENYSFFVLDEMETPAERVKEFLWMKKLNSTTRGIGYNYKDTEKSVTCFQNTPPYADGIPTPLIQGVDLTPKEFYIGKILEQCQKCDDLSLLDLVETLLEKSNKSTVEHLKCKYQIGVKKYV